MRDRSPDREQRAATLIARIRRSDPTALGLLMRCYTEDLTTFAFLLVRRMDLAQDAVQNVFIALWNRRTALALTGSVEAYLYRAVRNQAITILRHEDVVHQASEALQQTYGVGDGVAWNDGETRIAADEFDTIVRQALSTLQPQVREIFLMRRLQEMSYEEIALALEISITTVRSQMSRAMRKVAEALGHSLRD